MSRRPPPGPGGRPPARAHDQDVRDLARLLGRLIAARWRQLHADRNGSRATPRKGFTRHQ